MARHGQGATEYLVLLAVVLIIALVAIALLGFFPGTASDAHEQESRLYWQSATPVSITEWGAKASSSSQNGTLPYFRIRNNGAYKIALTKIWAGQTSMINIYDGRTDSYSSLKDVTALSPGEELYFGYNSSYSSGSPGLTYTFGFWFVPSPTPGSNQLGGFTQQCSSSAPYGWLVVPGFGFEYVQYVEGQQITKRQAGAKPRVIRCSAPCLSC